MSQGAFTLFDEYWLDLHKGVHDWSSDTFNAALITNAVVPTRDTATPRLADFTEVSGGTSYSAGGIALTASLDESSDVIRVRFTQGTISWVLDASGPTNVYYLLIYNDTASNDEAVGFVDMTGDGGTTPLSLQAADIQWTPETLGRIYTL